MKKLAYTLLLIPLFFLTGCVDSIENKILGKWKYSFSMDYDETNKISYNCREEFMPNKSSSIQCSIQITSIEKLDELTLFTTIVKLDLYAVGVWSVYDQTVYNKSVDSQITITEFNSGGLLISSDSTLWQEFQTDVSELWLQGETEKLKTISIDKNVWVYEIEMEMELGVENDVLITALRFDR